MKATRQDIYDLLWNICDGADDPIILDHLHLAADAGLATYEDDEHGHLIAVGITPKGEEWLDGYSLDCLDYERAKADMGMRYSQTGDEPEFAPFVA